MRKFTPRPYKEPEYPCLNIQHEWRNDQALYEKSEKLLQQFDYTIPVRIQCPDCRPRPGYRDIFKI